MNESIGNANLFRARDAHWTFFAVIFWLLAFAASLGFNQQYSEWLGFAGFGLMSVFVLSLFRGKLCWNTWLTLLWGFWLCWLVAFWFSPVSYVGETTLWSMVSLPVSATATYWLVRRQPSWWPLLFHGLLLMVAGLAFYGCYQFFVEHEPPRGTFINRNNFAALQILILLIGLGRYTFNRGGGRFGLYRGAILFAILLFSYVIGLIGSRGAMLALMCGVVLISLANLVYLRAYRRAWVGAGVVVAGLVLANFSNMGWLGERLASLATPFELSSGTVRFSIWSASADMLGAALPFGIGPGLYWLAYPPYRFPEDGSGGFYVHNDYLQFLIEAGPAALLVFLLLIVALTHRVLWFARNSAVSSHKKVEALSLFAALGAVAGHSLLTFNLYLVPILMAAGATLGQLFWLLGEGAKKASADLSANPFSDRRQLIKGFSWLIVVFAIAFYAKAIGGGYAFNEARQSVALKDWQTAVSQYQRAISFWGEVGVYHYSLAWALFEIERAQSEVVQMSDVELSMEHLDIAEGVNPYRPQPHFLRARILQAIGGQGEGDPSKLSAAVDGYQRAIELDPLYLDARFRLARLLLMQNEVRSGQAVLEEGLLWGYPDIELKQKYYRLTAEIRRILGDQDGYLELLERSREVAAKRQRDAFQNQTDQSLF